MKRVLFLTAVGALVLLTLSGRCKDPDDFAPPEDTLSPPPGPPQLQSPMDHYVFMTPFAEVEDGRFIIEISLSWDMVAGAEVYELELITGDLPPYIIHCEDNSYYFQIINDFSKLCDYLWRVRAGSTQWDDMTDWSEQWHFEARFQPWGPKLLTPLPDEVIMVDSLPVIVALMWYLIEDEQCYEVQIFNHGVLIDSSIVYAMTYECLIDSTETYAWQVRAGSALWQYFSYPLELRYFTVQTR